MSTIVLILEGQDAGLSGVLGKAQTETRAFGSAAQTTSGHLGVLGRAGTAASGALGHAAGQLKNLVTGPLGLIGLTGGILGAAGALEQTLGKVNDLAFGTEKLTAITGDSAEMMSTLIAVAEKYGVGVDKLSVIGQFYEKTTGKLAEAQVKGATATKSAALANLELEKAQRQAVGESTKAIDKLITEQKARDALARAALGQAAGETKLQALEKQYGIVLTDNTGKALPFGEALLNIADAYSKNADRANAAALAAQLMGKSWGTLAPLLELGKQGIIDLEQEAARMGLQLSAQNIVDFQHYRDAIRGSQEAIAGLEVAVGEDLLPTITDLAAGLQGFVSTHKDDILNFVKGAISAGRTAASDVVTIVSGIQHAWDMIPAPLRDLLVQGFVADRVMKFIFGVSPIHVAFDFAESLAKNAIGAALGKTIGSSVAGSLLGGIQKVWVVNPGFGTGAGGGMGAAEEGALAGGAGLLGAAGAFLGGAAIVAELKGGFDGLTSEMANLQAGNTKGAIFDAASLSSPGGLIARAIFGTSDPIGDLIRGITGQTKPPPEKLGPTTSMTYGPNTMQGPGIYGAPLGSLAEIQAQKDADLSVVGALGHLSGVMEKADWLHKLEASWQKAGQTMHDKIKAAIAGLSGPNATAAAGFLGSHLGNAGFGAGGYKQAQEVIAALQALHSGDPQVAAAIRSLEARLPRLKTDASDLARAEQIAQGTDPKNRKLDELNRIMGDLRAHGDATTRKKVEDLIVAVKAQKLHVTVNTGTNVDVYVSGGGVSTRKGATAVVSRYSNVRWEGAEGGEYPAGVPRLTGEEGPELDLPNHTGTIVKHSDTAALSRFLEGFLTPPPAAHDAELAALFAQLRALLAQLVAKPDQRLLVAAYATARDTEAAANRRSAVGPSRTRQGALGTR